VQWICSDGFHLREWRLGLLWPGRPASLGYSDLELILLLASCTHFVYYTANVTFASTVEVTGNLSVPVQATLEVQSALVVRGDLTIGAQSTFVISNSSANANGTSSQVLIQGTRFSLLLSFPMHHLMISFL